MRISDWSSDVCSSDLNFRYGDTELGGGESYNLTLAGGFSRGSLNAVLGVELNEHKPLWGYQRDRQDSSRDIADFDNYSAPVDYFPRRHWYYRWLAPGDATSHAPGTRHSSDGTGTHHGEHYRGTRPAAELQPPI